MSMRNNALLSCIMVIAVTCGIMSCEKDADSFTSDSDVTRISADDSIKAVIADSLANLARLDSVEVNFMLLNEEGKQSSTFAYGENITFQVTLLNHSKKVVKLTTSWQLIGGDNAFMVYTKEGETVGRPWDILTVPMVYPEPIYSIIADNSFYWKCKWRGYVIGLSEDDPSLNTMPFLLLQEKERVNLAKGTYYCKFTVCLGSNIYVDCRKDFIVE